LIRRSAASVELHELEQLLCPLGGDAPRQVEQPPLQDEELPSRLPRVEARLLEGDAHATPGQVGLGGHVDARDPRGARRDGQERRQHAHRRRLAGAVRTEEPEHLARADVEVDAAHRLDRGGAAAVGLDEARGLDRGRRPRGTRRARGPNCRLACAGRRRRCAVCTHPCSFGVERSAVRRAPGPEVIGEA
jgi:hypothetical protein